MVEDLDSKARKLMPKTALITGITGQTVPASLNCCSTKATQCIALSPGPAVSTHGGSTTLFWTGMNVTTACFCISLMFQSRQAWSDFSIPFSPAEFTTSALSHALTSFVIPEHTGDIIALGAGPCIGSYTRNRNQDQVL